MKAIWWVLACVAALAMLTGCDSDDSTGPEVEPSAYVEILIDSVVVDSFFITKENDATINHVYDGHTLIGQIEFAVYRCWTEPPTEESYTRFHAIARKDGCYSRYASTGENGVIRFDFARGFTAYDPDATCGVLFDGSPDSRRFYGLQINETIVVWEGEDSLGTIEIDDKGRFTTQLSPGEYSVTSAIHEGFAPGDIPFTLLDGYHEYFLPAFEQLCTKPNIYLYPPEPTTLDVSLAFPHGGEVTVSDPQYPDAWRNIHVTPDGMIDGEYGYLFYEAATPAFSQRDEGWVVARDELEQFFTANLAETGFTGREIDDFIEWWIPRLTEDSYAIYPQYTARLDEMIELHISQQPDNVLRLFYAVEPVHGQPPALATPEIPAFTREGFVVTEWGVVRLGEAGALLAGRE